MKQTDIDKIILAVRHVLKEEGKNRGYGLLFKQIHPKIDFSKSVGGLTPREQKVLEMRFGLLDGITHTLEEVGREFDVTRERIRQFESKALEKLKLSAKYGDQEICEHMPDDPDVTECHVCGFKVKE